jgi:hypothetical protein
MPQTGRVPPTPRHTRLGKSTRGSRVGWERASSFPCRAPAASPAVHPHPLRGHHQGRRLPAPWPGTSALDSLGSTSVKVTTVMPTWGTHMGMATTPSSMKIIVYLGLAPSSPPLSLGSRSASAGSDSRSVRNDWGGVRGGQGRVGAREGGAEGYRGHWARWVGRGACEGSGLTLRAPA